MKIGFTSPSQTVSESTALPRDYFPLTIELVSNRLSELEHLFNILYQDISSVAVVGPLDNRSTEFDALYGYRRDQSIQQDGSLPAGHNSTSLQILIYNDLSPEQQECFTIRIVPMGAPSFEDVFSCNELGPSYFCEHAICIEDDDGKCTPCLSVNWTMQQS